MVPLFEPSKKVVPLFEREKRWCHYLIITLKVVPLYDVYPNLYDWNEFHHVAHMSFIILSLVFRLVLFDLFMVKLFALLYYLVIDCSLT